MGIIIVKDVYCSGSVGLVAKISSDPFVFCKTEKNHFLGTGPERTDSYGRDQCNHQHWICNKHGWNKRHEAIIQLDLCCLLDLVTLL